MILVLELAQSALSVLQRAMALQCVWAYLIKLKLLINLNFFNRNSLSCVQQLTMKMTFIWNFPIDCLVERF